MICNAKCSAGRKKKKKRTKFLLQKFACLSSSQGSCIGAVRVLNSESDHVHKKLAALSLQAFLSLGVSFAGFVACISV